VNVIGTENVATAALSAGAKLLFVSTASVYGDIRSQDLPISEETPVSPNNNYGISKLAAEHIIAKHSARGLDAVVLRPFNHIGPGQGDQFVASSFAKQLAEIAAGKRPPQMKVGNLAVKRDFTDVRDICRAYRLAAEKGRGTYLLASGCAVAIEEILQTLIKIAGVEVEVTQDPERLRGKEIPEIYGTSVKAERELGWRPEQSLTSTLEAVYDYWVESIVDES